MKSGVPNKQAKGEGSVSTKELTKIAAARQSKNPYSLLRALKNGGPIVWLSCLIMGLGNIVAGQFMKGLIFLAIEVAVIAYLMGSGFHWLSLLPSLGDKVAEKVWDDNQGIYVYTKGDNSQQILLYAVATMAIIIAFVVLWRASVRSGYQALSTKKAGRHVPSFVDDVKGLFNQNIQFFFDAFKSIHLIIPPLIHLMLL